MEKRQHKMDESFDEYNFSADFYYMWSSGEVTARISNTTIDHKSSALMDLKQRSRKRPEGVGVEEWEKKREEMEDAADKVKAESHENLKKLAEMMKSLVQAELAKFDEKISKIK